jgi:AraC-like DNA-binding protein
MHKQTNRVPLHRFPLITTRNPDAFREMLVTKFGARGFDLDTSAHRPFTATRSYVKLKNVDLVFGACSAPYRVDFPGIDKVKQHFVLQQSGHTSFGGTKFNVSRSETAVIPPDVEMTHEYQAGFEQIFFRIDAAALNAKLSAVVGMPVSRAIEFRTPSRVNPSLQRLRRMLEFVVSELDCDEGEIPPSARTEYEQLLIISFLTANRHNFSELLERDQPLPAPWQVRRVEEYVAAHWDQPITVEALAAAAGASTRSIFKAFRDARACSPMAFVKSVRLEHARRMLRQPELTTTVVAVAYACGFLNPGHFARDYRLKFGELPSVTLALSKHQRH